MVGFWLGCFEARSEMPQYVFKCPGFEQLGTPLKKKNAYGLQLIVKWCVTHLKARHPLPIYAFAV